MCKVDNNEKQYIRTLFTQTKYKINYDLWYDALCSVTFALQISLIVWCIVTFYIHQTDADIIILSFIEGIQYACHIETVCDHVCGNGGQDWRIQWQTSSNEAPLM